MIRTVVFLVLIAGLALAVTWLADRPGDVTVMWLGYEIQTSVAAAIAAVAIVSLLFMMLWWLVRFVWRAPRRAAQRRRERRAERGRRAVSRGLVAIASGDLRAAERLSAEADRLAGDAPLALLLRAQHAQLAGDRARASDTFRTMTERPDTRLLGLRGLFIEAHRSGDLDAGRRAAEAATRAAPALPWAGHAVLELRCAAGDWAGAMSALEANSRAGLIERTAYRRQRAVLLTARGLSIEDSDPAAARTFALEAVKLAPALVPAVALAARRYAAGGDGRRAAKLIETAWRLEPHPDLTDAYAYLRPGDSARERLTRIRRLAALRADHRESRLALARAAIAAQEFATARETLAPMLERPTQRVAELMAQLAESSGDAGGALEWMSRAVHAGGEPRWTADGMVSDRWLPVSPVSGRIDAFEWRVPVEQIAGPALPHDNRQAEARKLPAPLPDATDAEPEPSSPPNVSETVATPVPIPADPSGAAAPAGEVGATPPPGQPAADLPAALPPAQPGGAAASPQPHPGPILPLLRAPDDPGPDRDDLAREGALRPQRLPARS